MRQVIDGVIYDSDTATELAKITWQDKLISGAAALYEVDGGKLFIRSDWATGKNGSPSSQLVVVSDEAVASFCKGVGFPLPRIQGLRLLLAGHYAVAASTSLLPRPSRTMHCSVVMSLG